MPEKQGAWERLRKAFSTTLEQLDRVTEIFLLEECKRDLCVIAAENRAIYRSRDRSDAFEPPVRQWVQEFLDGDSTRSMDNSCQRWKVSVKHLNFENALCLSLHSSLFHRHCFGVLAKTIVCVSVDSERGKQRVTTHSLDSNVDSQSWLQDESVSAMYFPRMGSNEMYESDHLWKDNLFWTHLVNVPNNQNQSRFAPCVIQYDAKSKRISAQFFPSPPLPHTLDEWTFCPRRNSIFVCSDVSQSLCELDDSGRIVQEIRGPTFFGSLMVTNQHVLLLNHEKCLVYHQDRLRQFHSFRILPFGALHGERQFQTDGEFLYFLGREHLTSIDMCGRMRCMWNHGINISDLMDWFVTKTHLFTIGERMLSWWPLTPQKRKRFSACVPI